MLFNSASTPMCLICKALPLVMQPVCINMIHLLNVTYELLPIHYLSAQEELKIHIKELVNSFTSGTAVSLILVLNAMISQSPCANW